MMNNILIFATICVLAVSVLSIGVSMPVLAQDNMTIESNPESAVQPEMEMNGTSMITNGTNATTTTSSPANATFG
jgi:hypothetical protein